MAILFIEQLEVSMNIGVYAHEHEQAQPVYIDLAYAQDIQAAASDEDLNATTDYDKVAQHIHAFAQTQHFNLLETFVSHLSDELQDCFKLSWFKLTVRKPQALARAQAAGISIERGSPPR